MKTTTLSRSALLLGLVFCSAALRAANPTPIALTGFNRDVVVENTATTPYSSFAANFNAGEANAFYQAGLPGKNFGLPANRFFTNAIDGSAFQFQPYNANNVLDLSSDTGLTIGTLNLTTPTTFSR